MREILHIIASPRAGSGSTQVAQGLLARWDSVDSGWRVRQRKVHDLAHPDQAFVTASLMPAGQRKAEHDAALALSESLLAELESAHAVLISTPMYNFSLPSGLKAWVDYVLRPQRSFAMTTQGKQGLLQDKPVLLIMSSGGSLQENRQPDFLSPYLRHVLLTMGMQQLEILRLQNMNRGAEAVATALREADAWIAAQCVRLSALPP